MKTKFTSLFWRNSNFMVIRLGLAAFAGSMLFVWQGLDFTDMGFWLTGYQQFYSHPDTLDFQSVCWLTVFIGHWVGLALGGSVLAYKLGFVGVVTWSAIIAYQLLASQLGRSRMLAAMVLLTVFYTRIWLGNWIGYNDLTALFYLGGAALLFSGLVKNRKRQVVLAGVVLGANIFIRLPNLLGITLVSAVWLHAWTHRWLMRDILIMSFRFLYGFMLGVALIWGLIILHGHEAIYLQGLKAIFDTAEDATSHHPASGLLRHFITDHAKAFIAALSIVASGSWIAKWTSKQTIFTASAVILACALLLSYVMYSQERWQYCVPGLCYTVLLYIIFVEARRDPSLALLAFIAVMILLLAPLGSNLGLHNSVFGAWLALPLSLIWLWQSHNLDFSLWFKNSKLLKPNISLSIEARTLHVFAIIIVLALLLQVLVSAWRHTWQDSNDRLAMTHSIKHPLLVGTYTTAERAKVVGELLEAMSHFTKPGDDVLAIDSTITIYFLTKTHPWLGISWPDFEDGERIAAMIRQKEQAGARLPTIVRPVGSTHANSWPVAAQPLATFWGQEEARRVFAEFVRRHDYVVIWSNDFFEILTPAQRLDK